MNQLQQVGVLLATVAAFGAVLDWAGRRFVVKWLSFIGIAFIGGSLFFVGLIAFVYLFRWLHILPPARG